MRLVFFGGIAGVGKTSLLRWFARKFPGQVRLLDPGALFRRYHYRRALMTTAEVEELVVKRLLAMPDNALVVIHWHFAVRRPYGFIPQVALWRLRRLVRCGKVERVMLLMVHAPNDVVRTRRLRDAWSKRRALSLVMMKKEVAAEQRFFERQRALFERALGRNRVSVRRLRNTDLRGARRALARLMRSSSVTRSSCSSFLSNDSKNSLKTDPVLRMLKEEYERQKLHPGRTWAARQADLLSVSGETPGALWHYAQIAY